MSTHSCLRPRGRPVPHSQPHWVCVRPKSPSELTQRPPREPRPWFRLTHITWFAFPSNVSFAKNSVPRPECPEFLHSTGTQVPPARDGPLQGYEVTATCSMHTHFPGARVSRIRMPGPEVAEWARPQCATHGTWIGASGLRAGDLCFQKLTVCLNLSHDGTDGNRTARTQERSEMKGHPEPPSNRHSRKRNTAVVRDLGKLSEMRTWSFPDSTAH